MVLKKNNRRQLKETETELNDEIGQILMNALPAEETILVTLLSLEKSKESNRGVCREFSCHNLLLDHVTSQQNM